MKKLILLIVIILMLPAICFGADKWTNGDKFGELVFQSINFIDWGQTRTIADEPFYQEHNKMIGENPTTGRVNLCMGLYALGHLIVTHFLPQKLRKYWQILTFFESYNDVTHNFSTGCNFTF